MSVVGSVKNSVSALESNLAAASTSDHDDSCAEEDDTYMDMSAQKIEPLQGGGLSLVECLH